MIYLYVDGKLVSSGSHTLGSYTSNNPWQIANVPGLSYFLGKIDDAKIFNYALSAEQVKNLFNQGSAIQFAPITGSP